MGEGIIVERGKTYRITASGRWRMAWMCEWTDADGVGLEFEILCFSTGGELVPDANFQTLIVRVGNAGRPFLVGKEVTFVARGDGDLHFRSNDDQSTLWDNEGSVRVTVFVK